MKKICNSNRPHVLALAYPAQGHVFPLMELCLSLLKHGVRVTFVNNEFIHERLMNEREKKKKKVVGGRDDDDDDQQLRLVSLPDWLDPGKDKNKPRKTSEGSEELMQQKLEELIIAEDEEDHHITCVIADNNTGWALKVAAKMGIRGVAFCPISATFSSWLIGLPKLIADGIINADGTPVKDYPIQLAPNAPAVNTRNFPWARLPNLSMQKSAFQFFSRNSESVKGADLLICNSCQELEPAAFELLAPSGNEIIPIGPLLASNRLENGDSVGNLWEEDSTCMKWLDQQPERSVIYVTFGSIASFNKAQFQELALGLELSNMPFLWVVRPNTVVQLDHQEAHDHDDDPYPPGFLDRVGSRGIGKIVEWAPQQTVLAHPSVACLFNHCGWNSMVEGINSGLPFLCLPYFADQFLNESYVCDDWKVGLRLNPDEKPLITGQEIKIMIEQLVGDATIRESALNLKDVALKTVREGGSSYNNFLRLVEWLKA